MRGCLTESGAYGFSLTGWPVGCRDLPLLTPQHWDNRSTSPHLDFDMDPRYLNSELMWQAPYQPNHFSSPSWLFFSGSMKPATFCLYVWHKEASRPSQMMQSHASLPSLSVPCIRLSCENLTLPLHWVLHRLTGPSPGWKQMDLAVKQWVSKCEWQCVHQQGLSQLSMQEMQNPWKACVFFLVLMTSLGHLADVYWTFAPNH